MLIRTPEQDIERILFTEKTIAARVEQLAGELTAKYGDKRPVLVCVLKGAAFFYIDLCRCMNCPVDMDFIAVSSYGLNDKSTGVVRLIKDLDNNITGRHVIIVEDIVDTGESIEHMIGELKSHNPASIEVCTLFFKPDSYRKQLPIKYRAMEIGNEFIVGYGLDYDQLGRSLKDIYVVTE